MNTLDIIILVPLAYFAFKGFTKGFIITLAMLAGILIGFYAAIHFSEIIAELLKDQFAMSSANIRPISYLLTFVIVLILVYLLGQFLTGVVKTTGLGFLNRIGGVILGLIKGLLILSAFVVLFGRIDPKSHLIPLNWKQESVFYQPLSKVAPQIFPVMKKYSDQAMDLLKNKPGSPEK